MKSLLISWMLLLFGSSLSSGNYIRDTEYGHPEVNQVREGPSGVTFVNSKPDQRTLREILYHIIERPREEHAITERSLDGYQFLEPESSDEYDEKEGEAKHDGDRGHMEDENKFIEDKDTETAEDEAYKTRSYLFDQMRQKTAIKRMAVPDSLKRKKREAELQPLPEAPSLSNKNANVLPKTYGMKLNLEGGYVWNNLNKPPSYYELGPSNGNSNKGQYPSAPSQENMPPEPSSSSLKDIVTTNRPSDLLETQTEPANPEVNDNPVTTNRPSDLLETQTEPANPEVNDNPVTSNSGGNYPVEPILRSDEAVPSKVFANNPIGPEVARDSGANKPLEPVLSNDQAEYNKGITNNPIGPKVYNNPEQSYGLDEIPHTQEDERPQPETPISKGPAEPVVDSNETKTKKPGYGYGQPEIEEPNPQSSSGESSEREKIKEMPEAPTLPPLNYDILPDYIRDAISSTEKPASYEKTDNPYINPQLSPNDKKAMKDKMEDILATMPPVEDIHKTYGMNLTSDKGHVWNDMVDPPVSYDVESPRKPDEHHKENEKQAPIIEQPEEQEEPANPIPVPAKPETEKPIANPKKPNQEPETHESEKTDNPIEQPKNNNPKPENEGELEKPISNPIQDHPELKQEPKPETPETEDKPIEEPAKPELFPKNPELIRDNPEVIPKNPEVIPGPGNGELHEIKVTGQPGDVEEPGKENKDHLEEPRNEPVEKIPEEENNKPGIMNKPRNEPVEKIPEEENNKPNIMNDLLESEQFWKWLGEWTFTYTELLEKHIRKIVIQEICKHKKSGEQMCPLDDKPEDTGVIIKDGKIIVDGREIDMTHTDNLDSKLKRHQNNKHENKGNNENKIEASTIYGNNVGNEKVTNVFIFTADKAEEAIDKLKPTNNSKVDFVIDDRIKEENKGEPNMENSIEDESNVEEVNKESNEGVNKEEPNNEETDKESNEGKATSELIKKDSNKSKANKEPNATKANTEELNNEEANKKPNEGAAAKEELNKEVLKELDVSEASKEDDKIKSNKSETNKESNATKANTEELNNEEANKKPNEGAVAKEELNKEVLKELDVSEASKEDDKIKSNKSETNKESNVTKANTEELNNEEANKKPNESAAAKEKLNKEVSKELDVSEAGKEDDKIKLNKSEANKKSNVTEANTEEVNNEEANKKPKEGAAAKEELNKEVSKESNVSKGDKKDDKIKLNKSEANKESNVTEANTEEVNNEEANKKPKEGEAAKEELNKEVSKESDVSKADKKDDKIESNKGVNKKENSDSKPEEDLKKDEELKGTSGDIGKLDDEADKSKLDSSEKKTSNSKGEKK